MAAKPQVFSLFWHAPTFAPEQPLSVAVALQHRNTIDTRPPVPAIIFFPALLTPTLHVKGENEGMIELLVAARKGPPLRPAHVNLHLKLAFGLTAKKRPSRMPLFANPKDKIKVEPVAPDGNGILKTKALFRGILDRRIAAGLPAELDGFYALQVHESCLEGPGFEGPYEDAMPEQQDLLIEAMLGRLNGPALHTKHGLGMCEFATAGGDVDFAKVDPERPIVAYHPLFVYPAGGLERANVGHVSDIHLNVRQEILARSPARVVDDDDGLMDSPPIGEMLNRCGASFTSVLQGLAGKGDRMDVLLVGGDLIDHIQNAFPYANPSALTAPSAAAIWNLVDLERNYATNYQAFGDFISFFTIIRNFCASNAKPVFGITGNHDCYEEAYGTSPRVAGGLKRANEGIPADINLTFYEAMLVFGETWNVVRRQLTPPNFTPRLFEWFYSVLTPFSDFSFALPKQRLVGLAWGETEEIISGPGSLGQGAGHLPRAQEAVTPGQLAVFNDGLGAAKKTVLLTHFTFVSYDDSVPIRDGAVAGNVDVGGPGLLRKGDPFGQNDLGTFQLNRAALYGSVANASLMSCVLTGHSHRKGLYFLGGRTATGFATEMYGLMEPLRIASVPNGTVRTPIIVSDSAGPLPRLNLRREFGGWGSDRPAGTLVEFDGDGKVEQVEAVRAGNGTSKPRLAVAVDYMHVLLGQVFESITVAPFEAAKARNTLHSMRVVFHEFFPSAIAGASELVLYSKPTVAAPWNKVPLRRTNVEIKERRSILTFEVSQREGQTSAFVDWLTLGSRSGRFLSFAFGSASGLEHVYDVSSPWNLEVDARPSLFNPLRAKTQNYEILPRTAGNPKDRLLRPEAPNFAWRRQFGPYQ